jgi:hypothetical protein
LHTSFPPCDAPRERYLRVRLAQHEHDHLRTLAASEGRSLSEFVRLRLASPPMPRRASDPLANTEPLGFAITMRDDA